MKDLNEVAEEIKAIIKGDVDSSSAALETYSHDTSLFEVMPSLITFPKDTEDISALVRFVQEKNKQGSEGNPLSLTARSAGTDMTDRKSVV